MTNRQTLFIMLLALLLTLFALQKAYAEDFPINLVVIESTLSPSVDDQIRLFQEGLERLSEVGVTPVYVSIRVVPDYFNVNSINDVLSRLFVWMKWGRRQHFKENTYFLLPPMQNYKTSQTYGGGRAGAVCTTKRNRSRRFGEVSMRMTNELGQNRENHSRVIALHEVLHSLGANHAGYRFRVTTNIMLPFAQNYASEFQTLPILNKTRKELGYCRKGLNVLGKKVRYRN